jgi:hypothetical protein
VVVLHVTDKGWRVLYFFEAIFYRILLMGFVHLLVAVLTAFIIVPLASLAVLVCERFVSLSVFITLT